MGGASTTHWFYGGGEPRKENGARTSVGSGAAQHPSIEARPCIVALLGRSVRLLSICRRIHTHVHTDHCPEWCKHDPSVQEKEGGGPGKETVPRTLLGSVVTERPGNATMHGRALMGVEPPHPCALITALGGAITTHRFIKQEVVWAWRKRR